MPFPTARAQANPASNPMYAPVPSSDSTAYRIVVSLTGNRQVVHPRRFASWDEAFPIYDDMVREFDDTNMIRWMFHEERSAVSINGDQVVCIKLVARSDERRPRVREARA